MKWITRLLDDVRNCICVKPYTPRTEQADFDWTKRFIPFRGKRHPPEVEAYLRHVNRISIDRSWLTSNNLCLQLSAMRYVRRWPVCDLRATVGEPREVLRRA